MKPFRSASLAGILAAASLGGFVFVEDSRTTNVNSTGAQPAQKQAPAGGPASPEQRAAWLRTRTTSAWRKAQYPQPGHTVRQGQRMARKAANQSRNRRAHRG